MSRTHRWWNKPQTRFRMKLDVGNKCPFCDNEDHRWQTPVWKEVNPFYYRHERKPIRVKIHRQTRANNKSNLRRGLDYEPEVRTNGWLTH